MRIIPLSRLAAQTVNVVLDGQYCTLSVYWRQERLYLDLDSDGVAVCRGAICQNGADVPQSKSPRFSGTLHFFDLEGNRPPHWERLHNGDSGRWVLVYASADEVPHEALRW